MKRKNSLILLILLVLIPINILAYSEYIIPGGENIGIEIQTNGVLVVGTYEIDGVYPANDAGIKKGDIITKVNDVKVSSIDELVSQLSNATDTVKMTLDRDNFTYNTKLNLKYEDGVVKTGIYVKDNITGIGTLSYIDPSTHIYGALGHEVIESNTGKMLEVQDGKIVSSIVTKIDRSENGVPGSKSAKLEDDIEGNILKNTNSGIFGKYTNTLPNKEKYKVATPSEIKKGEAKILTVLENQEVKEYKINILKIDSKDETKNILFEVTDEELLSKTGGIVQGMSGSPIIQGDYIIGAVTHVVVDDPKKGYGIFIINMLEEGERD